MFVALEYLYSLGIPCPYRLTRETSLIGKVESLARAGGLLLINYFRANPG
jgi:hypothetical protein